MPMIRAIKTTKSTVGQGSTPVHGASHVYQPAVSFLKGGLMIQDRNKYGFVDVRSYRREPDFRWLILIIFVLFIFSIAVGMAHAEEYTNEQIANAIYKAENSVKFPYGIKSINTHGDKAYARKICLNTIRNNRVRFAKQSRYSDFIEFLGSRYCPTTIKSEYNLNKNWVRNVKHFLGVSNV